MSMIASLIGLLGFGLVLSSIFFRAAVAFEGFSLRPLSRYFRPAGVRLIWTGWTLVLISGLIGWLTG